MAYHWYGVCSLWIACSCVVCSIRGNMVPWLNTSLSWGFTLVATFWYYLWCISHNFVQLMGPMATNCIHCLVHMQLPHHCTSLQEDAWVGVKATSVTGQCHSGQQFRDGPSFQTSQYTGAKPTPRELWVEQIMRILSTSWITSHILIW